MDFYHVLNRGVNKQPIVQTDDDRMRFVRSLYVFNDANLAPNGITQSKLWSDLKRQRQPLVHLHAWCLMNNHYHLLLSPVDDDPANTTLFMRKLNMGYAKFYNSKYERSGYLWQGRFKRILINKDVHFEHIPYYIHCNPLDYRFSQWRSGNIMNVSAALEYFNKYRWSSYLDYQGVHNFPSLLYPQLLQDTLVSQKNQILHITNLISGDLDHTTSSNILEG